jgi:hypothetical protein
VVLLYFKILPLLGVVVESGDLSHGHSGCWLHCRVLGWKKREGP